MTEREYDAVLVQDGDDAKPLVLFAAPATDIEQWVGVPQRLMLGDDETVGFQRTVSPQRLEALAQFFANPQNIIQNPLLGAIRSDAGVDVIFTPSDPSSPQIGRIKIRIADESLKPLKTLLNEVRLSLEARDTSLVDRPFPNELYKDLEDRARSGDLTLEAEWQPGPTAEALEDEAAFGDEEDASDVADLDDEEEDDADDGTTDPSPSSDLATGVEDALEQTHITEFWDQLRAREKLAENLGSSCPADALLGFTREVLISYLRPIILVDGQHRLAGAVEAAQRKLDNDPDLQTKGAALINEGVAVGDVLATQRRAASRVLPMSVTLNASPAEHVFQFVVVNQRATPVAKALLGTIVSTSLNADELETIRVRLERASVPVEGSQVVAALARNPTSPFVGKVARGFDPDNSSKLPWSVVGSLAEMFRTLRGGAFYHQPKPDYASTWAQLFLPGSRAVEQFNAQGYKTELAYWKEPAGPWQPMFVAFWTAVREQLGNETDEEAGNYWGNPRTSNLFNKPSLTILQIDFFAYLTTLQATLHDEADVKAHVANWLKLVDVKYFARDWKLGGVKKDAVGTRRAWSRLWFNYRQSPTALPKVDEYRKLGRD